MTAPRDIDAARFQGAPALLVLAPLRLEARAVRRGAPHVTVLRAGMGPRRARAAAARVAQMPGAAIAVVGVAGALSDSLNAGDLVVATEVRGPDGMTTCVDADLIAGDLRRQGLRAVAGPVVSTARLTRGADRRALGAGGALAVGVESAWLAQAADGRPFAVVRAVVDTPRRELYRPFATAAGGIKALRALTAAAPVLADWAARVRDPHTRKLPIRG
jgi:4-hydroxy-3-methylbut-2-en-1-yl diphosphate reductase